MATTVKPTLTEYEQKEVVERSTPRAVVVHEIIEKEGNEELRRTLSALAWSGLAAGLSMGFSLVTEGLLRSHLPNEPWRPIISKFGYTIGFLLVILGRQQLFTENTLTPILPLLVKKNKRTLLRVARLWGVVLLSNLVGAFIFAWIVGNTGIFEPGVKQAFTEIGRESMQGGGAEHLLRGLFAGWLIALMVWLLPIANNSRVAVIIIITFVVGLAGLSHIIAGSVETLYLVSTGASSFGSYLLDFMLPTLLGNIIGGVSLVAALNHAQVTAGGGEE